MRVHFGLQNYTSQCAAKQKSVISDRFYTNDRSFTSLSLFMSHHNFCKSCFRYPSQIRTCENGCEKWKEKCDKILLVVKEICSRDCEVDAQSIHWWEMAWRFNNLLLTQSLLRSQRNYCIVFPCWMTNEHLHRGDGEYSRSRSLRKSSHHCSNNLLRLWIFQNCLSIQFCAKIWKCGVTACWVPHFLTQEQRDHCTEICREWLKRIEDDSDVMGHVITDESWIHHFDPAKK